MHAIMPPLKPDDSGPKVVNLQDGLWALVEKEIIEWPEPDVAALKARLDQERAMAQYGLTTASLVEKFRGVLRAGELGFESDVGEATAKALNNALAQIGAPLGGTDLWVVEGVVTAQGKPESLVLVTVYDRDLRKRQTLADASTDRSGRYRIEYRRSDFQVGDRPERVGPWLIVEARRTPDATPTVVEKRANVQRHETINIELFVLAASEWERITVAIHPLLEGQAENGTDLPPQEVGLAPGDLEFLAEETNFDREVLSMWSSAMRTARDTELLRDIDGADAIEGPIYFGWFRERLPTTFSALLNEDTESLIAALERAIAKNTIPDALRAQLERIRAAIDTYRLNKALEPAGPGQPATIGDLLNTVGAAWLARRQRLAVVDALGKLDPTSKDFETLLRDAGIAITDVAILRRTIRLDSIALKHLPMIAALQDKLKDDDKAGSVKGLAKLTILDWIDLALDKGAPPASFLSPEQYAKHLETQIEDAFPAAVLARKLAAEEFDAEQLGFSSVKQFLSDNPDFDFDSAQVGELLEGTNLEGVGDVDQPDLEKALTQLWATRKVGARWDEAEGLIRRGLSSVQKLAEYGTERLKAALGGEIDEGRIYTIATTAQDLWANGIGLVATMMPWLRQDSVAVMASSTPSGSAKEAIDGSPSLRRIFGALESCACDPCQSVVSPAAYLVDLLRFVEQDLPAAKELMKRRPDLVDLELSCENTQIELPYIDLVNEILENAVVFLPDGYKVSLPSNTDVVAALSKPLDGDIKKALQQTALEPLDTLTAVPDADSPGTGGARGVSDWVVTDKYRRWTLRATSRFFGIDGSLGTSMRLDGVDIDKLIAAMGGGTNPQQITPEFDRLLRAGVRVTAPLDVTSLRVTPIEPGVRWMVTFIPEATLLLDRATNTTTLTDRSGREPRLRRWLWNAFATAAGSLSTGELPLFAAQLYSTLATDGVTVTEIGPDKYQIAWPEIHKEVVYRGPSLVIAGLTYQSTEADRTLKVRPQNRNPLAYGDRFLGDAVFPWTLPFDLHLVETRALLARAGWSRLALMTCAKRSDKRLADPAIARERIALSASEAELIANRAADEELWLRWGLNVENRKATLKDTFSDQAVTDAPLVLLGRVSILLQQARLRLVELQDLLGSAFINPSSGVKIAPDDKCDPTELTLTNLSSDFLDRLQQFVRLQRRLGWSTRDLDIAIRAVSPKAGLTEDALIALSIVAGLRGTLGVEIEVIATWLGGFDRESYTDASQSPAAPVPPLYERLFQDKRLRNPPDPDLAYAKLSGGEALGDRAPLVAAAIGLSQDSLLQLLQLAHVGLASLKDAALSEDVLRDCVRHAGLQRALGLSTIQYRCIWRLCANKAPANHPFSSAKALAEFCDEAAFVRSTGFEPHQLSFILTQEAAYPADWTLTPERAREILLGLQAALRMERKAAQDVSKVMQREPGRGVTLSDADLRKLEKRPATEEERFERWDLQIVDGQFAETPDPDKPTVSLMDRPLDLLKRLRVLARQARLSIDAMADVLQLPFVTPSPQGKLDIDKVRFPEGAAWGVKSLSAEHLDRLERFLILLRATDLSPVELDLAIWTLAGGYNDETLEINLVALAEEILALRGLQDQIGLPVDRILSLIGGLRTPDYRRYDLGAGKPLPVPAAFDRLFPPDRSPQAFTLNPERTRLEIEASTDREDQDRLLLTHRSGLAKPYGLDEADVDAVLLAGFTADGTLSLENLSQLNRILSLTAALRIPPLSILRSRGGLKRFESVADVITFVSRARDWVPVASAVATGLAEAFGLAPSLIEDLLWDHLKADANLRGMEFFLSSEFSLESNTIRLDSSADEPAFALVSKVHRFALLNQVWKLSRRELTWLATSFAQSGPFSGMLLDDFPAKSWSDGYAAWKQTASLVALARSTHSMPRVIQELAEALKTTSTDRRDPIADVLADAFQLPRTDVLAATGSTFLALESADCSNPARLVDWINLVSTMQRLGVTTAELEALVSGSPTASAVRAARHQLRTRCGEARWEDALREVNNEVREQQREMLVDYLLWRDGLWSADALYERYLIDVQMSSCMSTTRILQGVSAVQLFVQRCLMNLERANGVLPNALDPDRQWEWRKSYRVWEANRKVFLFPENWLFPELRDDKSQTFRNFEAALTQNQASDKPAVDAVRQYLDDLLEISQITVVGMYVYAEAPEKPGSGRTSGLRRTLYVFGRSPNPPYVFFWRQALGFGESGMRWTPWERIDLDLSGDHIVPFVFEGDLHVAWPLIKAVPVSAAAVNQTFYEVQLAWARRTSTGWTRRKASGGAPLRIEKLFNRDERSMFAFRLQELPSDSAISILCYAARKPASLLSNMLPKKLDGGVTRATPTNQSPPGSSSSIALHLKVWRHYTGSADYFERMVAEVELVDVYEVPFDKIASLGSGSITVPGATTPLGRTTGGNRPIRVLPDPRSSTPTTTKISFSVRSLPLPGVLYVVDDIEPFGFSYDITVDLVFDAGVSKNPEIVDDDYPLPMDLQGRFYLEPGSDGRFDKAQGQPVELQPPPGMYSYQSGYREDGSGKGLPRGIDKSKGAQTRMYALEASRSSTASGRALWYVEEDQSKLFLSIDRSTNPPSRAYFPSSYEEVGQYKRTFLLNRDKLYLPTAQSLPDNPEFEATAIRTLFFNAPEPSLEGDVGPIAFNLRMPYAPYNWEIFHHIPIAEARVLSAQHRFEDARHWMHCIFDPTTSDASSNADRYWRFLPFRDGNQPDSIAKSMEALADPKAPPNVKAKVQDQVDAWLADPFNPFAIARLRTSAFEWFTLIAYIRNLIDWGDSLFRRDTRETVNEATLLYVLAAKILGRRPERVRSRNPRPGSESYRSLRNRPFDDFSNAWIALSPGLQAPTSASSSGTQVQQLGSIGNLYFCIPQNERILELWDMTADRLFKIRHCQNIDGVTRDLPLFEPPIDPELLVRAKAAGLDLADVLSERFAPAPRYRFSVMLQKAIEVANEVKALGAGILSAIEKKEGERLALLRSKQEIEMLGLVKAVKQEQIKEADENLKVLRQSRDNVLARFRYLQRLLGKNEVRVDASNLPIMEQTSGLQVQDSSAPDDFRSLALVQSEVDQIWRMQEGHLYSTLAGGFKTGSGVSHTVAAFAAIDAVQKYATAIGHGLAATGDFFGLLATNQAGWERRAGMIAGFQRRREDWVHQSRTAVDELKQIDKQITAAEIRKAIAEKDLDNHQRQIEHAQNIDDYMRREKFTNSDLYAWMESQLSGVHFSAYQMAFDLARRAERAFRAELGEESTGFIQYGLWDSMRKGLLAGERLANDLRRMEVAYLDRNRRELELTKHISLISVDPLAVVDLRQTGRCEVRLPEALFDLDCPGHFMRRIRSVSLTIPCVTGPYTGVHCKLTLLKSSIRRDANPAPRYQRDSGKDDPRFTDSFTEIQSMVTSSAQNDSGLFETNLRDERYLYFEGAGTISQWRLELPAEFQSFDYDTISDVVLHVRYTARDGGDALRAGASSELKDSLNRALAVSRTEGLARLFSLRQEFPSQWHQLLTPTGNGQRGTTTIDLGAQRFPFIFHSRQIAVSRFLLLAKPSESARAAAARLDKDSLKLSLAAAPGQPVETIQLADQNGLLIGEVAAGLPAAVPRAGSWNWNISAWQADAVGGTEAGLRADALEEIWIVAQYTLS